MNFSITREDYIDMRPNFDVDDVKMEILRAYFNMVANLDLDLAEYFQVEYEYLEEEPGFKEDIDFVYSKVLECLDVYYGLIYITVDVELTKVTGIERRLKKIF